LIGAVLAVIVMAILLIDLWSMPVGSFLSYLFLLWLVLGLIYFELRRRALLQKGIDIKALSEIPEEDFLSPPRPLPG